MAHGPWGKGPGARGKKEKESRMGIRQNFLFFRPQKKFDKKFFLLLARD